MSFVTMVISKKFITVMSDGRVSGKNHKVLEENYKKFKKISPTQFIAYVGSRAASEVIVNQIEYVDKQIYNMQDLTFKMKEAVSAEQFHSINVHFAIGGIDLDGQLRIYSISNLNKGVDIIQNESDDVIKYKFLPSPHIFETMKKEEMEEHFIQYLRKTGFNTPNKCLRAQKLLSDFLSETDRSVNKSTHSLKIVN